MYQTSAAQTSSFSLSGDIIEHVLTCIKSAEIVGLLQGKSCIYSRADFREGCYSFNEESLKKRLK